MEAPFMVENEYQPGKRHSLGFLSAYPVPDKFLTNKQVVKEILAAGAGVVRTRAVRGYPGKHSVGAPSGCMQSGRGDRAMTCVLDFLHGPATFFR